MKTTSDFKYSGEYIEKLIKKYRKDGIHEAAMSGVHKDLEKLKPIIEDFYDNYILYIDHWESDAPYHGWSAKDNPEWDSTAKITEGIKDSLRAEMEK